MRRAEVVQPIGELEEAAPSGGRVVAIHLASTSGAPMTTVDTVDAVAGRGLRGDRYFKGDGASKRTPEPGREVTLIEQEAIQNAAQEASIDFQSTDSRRNIVTRGVALNDLVGREFRVGQAVLRGTELCEPCSHMIQLSGKRVLRSLVHHGGIRADIISDGLIQVGDAIEVP